MTGPSDNDPDENEKLHGPSLADIERFNREDADILDDRRRAAKTAAWKLVGGALFMLIAASMILNVLLPALARNRVDTDERVLVPATVTGVIDGRTLIVEIAGAQQTVRYIGVETPFYGEPFYDIATATNSSWVLGHQVGLESDERDTDIEGRLLRYVWLEDAMINLNLIAVGLSRAGQSEQNIRYFELFKDAEQIARSQSRGIWQDAEPVRSTDARIPDRHRGFRYTRAAIAA